MIDSIIGKHIDFSAKLAFQFKFKPNQIKE